MTRRPPISPLFPYTTLFRSADAAGAGAPADLLATLVPKLVEPANAGEDRKSTRLNSSHGYISYSLFFFNDPAPPDISPLPLHDALPICRCRRRGCPGGPPCDAGAEARRTGKRRRRSEEHTSELQSRLHLLFPLFF